MVRFVFCILLFRAFAAVELYELNILHLNDVHSHIDGTSRSSGLCRDGHTCYGGLARVLHQVKLLNKTESNVIFLNAGDMFQGTPYFTRFKSDILVDFVDKMGFDAQALGNHEFDEGVPELAKYLKRITTPMLCCNIDASEEPSLKTKILKDSIILNIGGVKIGIAGYLTTDILPANRGKLKILSEVPCLRKAAADLRNAGAKIVIGLGHSGYKEDLRIAKEAEGVDVIVGGHSHTFLYSGPPREDFNKPKGPYPTMVVQPSGKTIPVVQAFQFTKYLGHLKLHFDDQFRLVNATGGPILLHPSLPRDKAVLELQNNWDRNMTDMCSIVGTFSEDLEGDRTVCRYRQCSMGDFVADALFDYTSKKINDSVIIAFVPGGTIRSTIEKGNATVAEVTSVMPFKDPAVVLRMTGAVLREALELSVKDYSRTVGTPRFIQTSGMRLKFDLKSSPGKRLLFAKIRGEGNQYGSLNDSSTYTVAMSKFTYNGGDEFQFKQNSTLIFESEGRIDRILLNYLRARGMYDTSNKIDRVEIVNS